MSGISPSSAPRTKKVAHYEIVSELGRGGMGVVYRARDLQLDREVALKSPLPEHSTDRDYQRLLVEARAAARLAHPHIVPIFEVIDDGGRPWLAMELVEGRSLRAILADTGPLPVEEVVRHGQALAEALEAAHEHQILHRDVKPSNIMVTADGRAQLMDFGLAQSFIPLNHASHVTATAVPPGDTPGLMAGTPGYMSPEQILGRPLDPRSDLFSLGAVLFEMCAGRPGFVAPTSGALFDAILNKEPVLDKRFSQNVPPELERIIHKALAKRPDERYQTARDLAADLRTLRRQLESGRAPLRLAGPRWNRTRLATAGFVVGAVTLFAALWPWLGGKAKEPFAGARPRQLTSATGWEGKPALSPDGSLVAYASDESGNPDIWIIDARGGSQLRLTDYEGSDRDPTWFPDGTAIAFVSTRSGTPGIWKVPRLGGSATLLLANAETPAISPDGQQIAFARQDASDSLRIAVAPLADTESARFLTHDTDGLWNHQSPAWSPDGLWLCYAAQRALWIVPAAGGKARRLTTDDEYDYEPVWSSDGREVYFASLREGTDAIWRVPAAGGKPTRVTMGTGPERQPDLSNDGTRLAYSTLRPNPDLVILDLVSGKEHRLTGLRDDIQPAFAPDAASVVFGSQRWAGRFDLWIQPLVAGEPTGAPRRLTDHPGSATHPAYSPDGRWIAYGRVLGDQRDIWMIPVNGGASTRITQGPAAKFHPAWSRDGSRLAFVASEGDTSQIRIVRLADGRPAGPERAVTSIPSVPVSPVWSPDGSKIAYIGGDFELWVVPVDGSQSPTRVTYRAGARRVRWTPRGLFVSGLWGGEVVTIREVSPTGAVTSLPFTVTLGRGDGDTLDFDLTPDFRFLTFSREEVTGDIWVLEKAPMNNRPADASR